MTMDRFTSDFDRIFDDHEHDCPIQKAVESGKRPIAAVSRFAALDKSAASSTRTDNTYGEKNV